MHKTTQELLRSEADLHAYGQSHGTDRKGITQRAKARGRAIDAGVREVCPDLAGGGKPAVTPKAEPQRDRKDWTPTLVCVDVLRLTERGALLSDGGAEVWCPREWVRDGHEQPIDLQVDHTIEAFVPMWAAREGGWL